MYIVERRKELKTKHKIFDSIEVASCDTIEDQQFIDDIKKEISTFIHYNFIEPDLKEGELLKVLMDDGTTYRWIMFEYKRDMDPFVFLASASDTDAFTDMVILVEKWKKEIAENGYKPIAEKETKNTGYIIA